MMAHKWKHIENCTESVHVRWYICAVCKCTIKACGNSRERRKFLRQQLRRTDCDTLLAARVAERILNPRVYAFRESVYDNYKLLQLVKHDPNYRCVTLRGVTP